MAIDGSETGNIERQSLGDPLASRTQPLKQHGSNVVDRSFKQTATPVGTPENIMNTLLEAAGHVGTAAGTYMQRQVEEDVTKQSSNFYQGMQPSDDTTTAGYRAHAVLAMSNATLLSTARLKNEALTWNGTDAEWDAHVAASQTTDRTALDEKYPALKSDPLAGKAIVAMYGEQVPAIAASRIGAKLAQEHEARLLTLRDSIRVRADGLKPEDQYKVYDAAYEHGPALQFNTKDVDKEVSAFAIERAEAGDLSVMEYTKIPRDGHTSSLFDRSNALQKAEVAGKKVFEMQNQDVIAKEKLNLQERLLNGEMTEQEFMTEAGAMNRKHSNLAYTDDSMLATIKASRKPPKDPAMLHAGEDATAKTKLETDLAAGVYGERGEGYFSAGQVLNDKATRPVVSAEWLMSSLEKWKKGVAENTDVTKYTSTFFTQDLAGSVPLGQVGLDTKTNDAIIASAKTVIDREGKREIAALPLNHSPADEQAIRDKYTALYIQKLSASRLKDPEFVRILGSFKLTDMADAPNMKNLNPNTERAITLYNSMDEGAKAEHIPEKTDRALFENFNTFVEEGHSRVSAMEKAIYANRHPRNLTSDDLKAIKSVSKSVAHDSTSNWVGAIPFSGTSMNAPDWYQAMLADKAEKGITANMMGGVIDPKSAAKLYKEGFDKNHTRLPDGKMVLGTIPVLAARMGTHPEDVPKVLSTYLEMNKDALEDAGHVPIKDMYLETNPERGTFVVKTRLGDTLGLPAPLSSIKTGAGAFLENKKFNWTKAMEGFNAGDAMGTLGVAPPTLNHSENHVEFTRSRNRTVAFVEGNGGFDTKIGTFKPYRDGNGKQWNIGYGLAISDKEYKQDYIVRQGVRYDLGNKKPSMITATVAANLMEGELSRGEGEIRSYWKNYDKLPDKYKIVLSSLHYNTGNVRPQNWPKLMEAMNNGNDAAVRKEMVTSFKTTKGEKFVLTGRAKTVADRAGLK